MSETPPEWFDALGVEASAVGRVGYSLAAYADDHELPRTELPGSTDEHRLMLATTLAEAATLLALVEPSTASERLAQAASLFEEANAPESWVAGMASGGAWEPRRPEQEDPTVGRPSDAMSSLVWLYSLQETKRENSRSRWATARQFAFGSSSGWTALGAPFDSVAEFALAAAEGMTAEAAAALDQVIARSDETIRMAQEQDTWRWQIFVSSVPLVDPELLALGVLSARADRDLVLHTQSSTLTPARVAVLAGMRLAANHEPPLDAVG